jgi:hypothetical protein
LPEGITIDVLLGKYLKISDKMGGQFVASTFGGSNSSGCILVKLDKDSVGKDFMPFSYAIGNISSVCSDLQKFVDKKVRDSIYRAEFDANVDEISLGENRLCVKGPNRNGDFELSSENSSLIYDPRTDSVTLNEAFNTYGAKSSVISGRISEGAILVKDNYGKRGHQVWKLSVEFGNEDPNKSYSAELVENSMRKEDG